MTRAIVETLQSFCLNLIVYNFDKYCLLLKSKCQTSERYLEFIQKRYGKQILEMLGQRKLLKNEHVSIVINKYTKELDFRDLLPCDIDVIEEQLVEVGHVISQVSMIGLNYFNYDALWKYLCNAEVIQLQYSVCTDKSVISISDNCPFLKCLNVFGCVRITDKSINYLSKKKPPLETFIIEKSGATYKSVALMLTNIPTLRKVWFSNLPRAISEALGVSANKTTVNKKFNLNNIVFINHPMRPSTYLDSCIEMCHSVCPFIKDLTVTDIVTYKQITSCCLFKNLEYVNLHCSTVAKHELSINNFLNTSGHAVKNLALALFTISLETLANSCLNLQCLTLENICFESNSANEKEYCFPNLRILTFNNSELNASSAHLISSCPNLEELYLHMCSQTQEVIQVILQKPKKLRSLSFNGSPIEVMPLLEVLKVHANLKELNIKNTDILPNEYDYLMDFVDKLEKDTAIVWADYTQAIRELYASDGGFLDRNPRSQILKL